LTKPASCKRRLIIIKAYAQGTLNAGVIDSAAFLGFATGNLAAPQIRGPPRKYGNLKET
jgi:hypothetical protein